MKEKKTQMRRLVKERRRELTETYCKTADTSIAGQVIGSEAFQKAETIFCYISMPGEPDTAAILEAAWKSGKRVCVPKCLDRSHMAAIEIASPEELRPGKFEIPEPYDLTKRVDPELIDLAIVPCIAASLEGGRLGHGAGYYDRFLGEGRMYKMCICYRAMLFDAIPMDSYDIRMDEVIADTIFES